MNVAFNQIPFHDLANIFPLVQGAEFDALCEDIATHGVRENVVLFEGAILDGRNRYRASQVAGVDCPMEEYRGDDAAAFVVSLNIHRRHLTESQRAMAAAKLANMSHGGNRVQPEQDANLHLDIPLSERAKAQRPVTQSDAARLLNVSPRSVAAAKQVQVSAAPEVSDAVDAGRMSVSLASKATALSKEAQAEIVRNSETKSALRRSVLAAVDDARRPQKEKNPIHRKDATRDRVFAFAGLCSSLAEYDDVESIAAWSAIPQTAERLPAQVRSAMLILSRFLEAHDA